MLIVKGSPPFPTCQYLVKNMQCGGVQPQAPPHAHAHMSRRVASLALSLNECFRGASADADIHTHLSLCFNCLASISLIPGSRVTFFSNGGKNQLFVLVGVEKMTQMLSVSPNPGNPPTAIKFCPPRRFIS